MSAHGSTLEANAEALREAFEGGASNSDLVQMLIEIQAAERSRIVVGKLARKLTEEVVNDIMYLLDQGVSVCPRSNAHKALRALNCAEEALRCAEPEPERRLTDEEVEVIIQQQYSPDISPADWARSAIRAAESAIAALWGVKLP